MTAAAAAATVAVCLSVCDNLSILSPAATVALAQTSATFIEYSLFAEFPPITHAHTLQQHIESLNKMRSS